eukprot:768672-Hanusia_phi.AAC.25
MNMQSNGMGGGMSGGMGGGMGSVGNAVGGMHGISMHNGGGSIPGPFHHGMQNVGNLQHASGANIQTFHGSGYVGNMNTLHSMGQVDIPQNLSSVLDSVAAGVKRPTRKTWSDTEKKAVLDLLNFNGGSKKKTLDALQAKYGNAFQTISLQTLKRWQNAMQRADMQAAETGEPVKLNRKRGKKTCTPFEEDLLNRLLQENLGDGAGHIPYATVINAANALRNESAWREDDKVKKLRFSNTWVRSFLLRNNLKPPEPIELPRYGPGRMDERGRMTGVRRKRSENNSGRGRQVQETSPPPSRERGQRTRRLENQVAMLKMQLEDERRRNSLLEQQLFQFQRGGEPVGRMERLWSGQGIGGVAQPWNPDMLNQRPI